MYYKLYKISELSAQWFAGDFIKPHGSGRHPPLPDEGLPLLEIIGKIEIAPTQLFLVRSHNTLRMYCLRQFLVISVRMIVAFSHDIYYDLI